MKLIATQQIYSSTHGQVLAGEAFDWPEADTKNLLATGAARYPYPPKIQYETKPILPEAPEVSARLPFRDVPVFDLQPEGVATESDRVFSATDVPAPRVAGNCGRRGR